MSQDQFLNDLFARCGRRYTNPNGNIWFLERNGARIVEPLAGEPDPNTFRGEYYYNSIENMLYRKIKTIAETFVWKRMI